jgi:hypothetical protein
MICSPFLKTELNKDVSLMAYHSRWNLMEYLSTKLGFSLESNLDAFSMQPEIP